MRTSPLHDELRLVLVTSLSVCFLSLLVVLKCTSLLCTTIYSMQIIFLASKQLLRLLLLPLTLTPTFLFALHASSCFAAAAPGSFFTFPTIKLSTGLELLRSFQSSWASPSLSSPGMDDGSRLTSFGVAVDSESLWFWLLEDSGFLVVETLCSSESLE